MNWTTAKVSLEVTLNFWTKMLASILNGEQLLSSKFWNIQFKFGWKHFWFALYRISRNGKLYLCIAIDTYGPYPRIVRECNNYTYINQKCTARVWLHHCGLRSGAVLSSDKHWHAVLDHCSALLDSYDSSTAVSALTGRSSVLVIILGHCQAPPYDRVTAYVKDFYQMRIISEQCLIQCIT